MEEFMHDLSALGVAVEEAESLFNETFPEPIRVKVWDGSGKVDLGQGNYVGNVTVYFFRERDGALKSEALAENKPGVDQVAAALQRGAIPWQSFGNPKIILDSGQIVYGCQVWWQVVDGK
jgi:hypothetical protein